MFEVDPKVEQRYLWVQNRLFDLRYAANLLTGEASTVVGSEARVAKWKAEIEALKTEMTATLEQYPLLVKSLEKFWTRRSAVRAPAAPAPRLRHAACAAAGVAARGRRGAAAEPARPRHHFERAVHERRLRCGAIRGWQRPAVHLDGLQAGRSPRFPGAAARQCRDARRDRPAAFSGRTRQGRRLAEERIGTAGTGGEDLHRRGAAGRAGDRQPRVGLAFRQAAGGHAERFRRAGREADASGTAGRSGGALHRARLVA